MKHRTGVGTTDSGARLPGVPVPAVAVSCMNVTSVAGRNRRSRSWRREPQGASGDNRREN